MNTLGGEKAVRRYSAHDSMKPINLYCHAPRAETVELIGDFNSWKAVLMDRRLDGWWSLQVVLCHGHHQYRFLVDGDPELDPSATGIGRDEHGEPVSLIAVS